MAKSKKKQKAEAALKASRAHTAEGKQEAATAAAAEAAREKASAAAESEAATARKARGATPKAVKVKKARHVRPTKRAPATATVSSTPARSTFAGMVLAQSVRKSLPKPDTKPREVKRPGSSGPARS